jgi:uncharacterized membrane-anchored protein
MPQDEKHIIKYLDDIDKLKDKVTKDSEIILEKVDLDELRKNPQEYIYNLGKQFYEAHNKELKQAITLGEKKAKKILGK